MSEQLEDCLFTVSETAKILKTNRNFIYDLFKHGLLQPLKIGSLKVRKKEILRFMEQYQGKDISDLDNIKELNLKEVST